LARWPPPFGARSSFPTSRAQGRWINREGGGADLHAEADYRAHLIGVMVRRAVAAAG
jgi:carbon-monoxide dehydrogenase medium subunit